MDPTLSLNRRLWLLLCLYVCQGLPTGVFTQALPAILRSYGVPLTVIGFSGLLAIPWALKFLWAPFVERYFSLHWGQRRSWILPMQLAALVMLVAIALFDPMTLAGRAGIQQFFILMFLVNLFAATQDIATDGLAVRTLAFHERGIGNGVQVAGYRVGLIIGGGLLLYLIQAWDWRLAFLLLAALLAVLTLPVLRFREPPPLGAAQPVGATQVTAQSASQPSAPLALQNAPQILSENSPQGSSQRSPQGAAQNGMQGSSQHALQRTPVTPEAPPALPYLKVFTSFFARPGLRGWLVVLVTYKVGESLGSAMVKPMLVDMGLDLKQIGIMVSMVGSVAALTGALAGGWLTTRLGRYHALIGFGALQAIGIGLYAWLPWWQGQGGALSLPLVYVLNAIEHFVSGMAMAALLTAVMDLARAEHAAADFTVQVSILAIFGGSFYLVAGVVADAIGYTAYFLVSAGLSLILLWPAAVYCRRLPWLAAADLPAAGLSGDNARP